jgi:hypothetical protein
VITPSGKQISLTDALLNFAMDALARRPFHWLCKFADRFGRKDQSIESLLSNHECPSLRQH